MAGHLHVFFLPMLAQGHMIPALDIAKLFATRGVNATIITTPLNASVFSKSVERTKQLGFELSLKIIKFPAVSGLPEDCENADQLTSPEMFPAFFTATYMLKQQVEQLLEEYRPNCLVADMFYPWATDSAAKFHIPTLVFHGTGFFTLCASEEVRLHKPFKDLLSDSEPFVLPNLPHELTLTKRQLSPNELAEGETEFSRLMIGAREAEKRSYGVIVNSFYELEPEYAQHYRNVLERRAWHIGPVSLCNRGIEDKAERGKKADVDKDKCLKWLDSKKPDSVIYVCFGSACNFPSSQLYELAVGLERSGQNFIWVVRKTKNSDENEEWLPEGFEDIVKGRGLIIRGWAPQVLILDHEAVGGFVTHCGWNSSLEGISAGVPFVTWPCFADQFYNEKLLTEILRIGVAVGSKVWAIGGVSGGIKREDIETAVRSLMEGEEAMERRNRAKSLKDMAKKAVEEGGSSYLDLDALIKELSSYRS